MRPGSGPRDRAGMAPIMLAWIMLDWAASSFSTVLITLVVFYVEKIAFRDGAGGMPAGVVWAWTLAAAMLVSAVAAPWLSAWADRTAGHRLALIGSVALGTGSLAILGLAPPEAGPLVITGVVLASVGFDLAAIFTAALLPRIARGPEADRLSAAGFAAGYAGGGLALVAATALAAGHGRLGLSPAGGLRAAFLFTAGWWFVFSVPAAIARFGGSAGAAHAGGSARELVAFARSLGGRTEDGRLAPLSLVLGGATLVLGAVQTAIAQFSSVALEEFRLDGPALVRLVLLVQAVALPGALFSGWLATRTSRGLAIRLCLAGWISVLAAAFFVRTVPQLHGLAVLLALVLGGVQSVIRSTVSDAAPAGRSGATFGVLQVGTKLAGFLASGGFGLIYQATGSPRAGLALLAAQILAGWWVLRRGR